ncbi:alpha-2-macroglobulin family protein [Fontimonas sp. SYSU GA230001]|uniref:alpha-2-macroglobulin family protein n=1 Tax=Fontimonas sp. SYSU GA230001 TaxID=3142450 RepID=UPI0032B5A626
MSRTRSAVVALLAAVPGIALGAELQVTRITPSGDDVRNEGQITIGFDRAVVPLGRMERAASEVPVTITPDPSCQWRWLDPQLLACNLPPDTRLLPATEYRVDVRPELESFDGVKLSQGATLRFVTERPALRYAHVADWRGPEQPELQVTFNQPVTAKSVAAALRLGGAVEVGPVFMDRQTPFYTPDGEARRSWRVWPRAPLKPDSAYRLVVQAGLESALGRARGIAADPQFAVRTFPALRYLGIDCQVGDGLRRFAPGDAVQDCAPLERLSVVFSAPVDANQLRPRLRIDPDPFAGRGAGAEAAWEDAGDNPVIVIRGQGRTYPVGLPFALAAETEYTLDIAAGVTDRFGRRLDAPVKARITTGARRPRFVFEHGNAVLESGIDSEVPAIVTNLQAVVARYTRMTAAGIEAGQETRVPVAPVRNLAFAMPLDVRGMVGARGGTSGAVRGELSAQPADGPPREFFAQVTPWQVHAKFGHANTLVWVTRFDDGAPVADAEVAVIEGFGDAVKASGRTDADGLALLPGSAELDPALDRAWKRGDEALAVRVRKDGDFALLPLEYEFSVDTWRASREQISAWRRERHGHLRAWGTTAQGVYRAGDTVQYKLYVRDDAGRTLAAPPSGTYALSVSDPTGTVVHERKDVVLSRFGALDGEFTLAKGAAVGWYRFALTPSYSDAPLEPLRVLVADFVPAPFRVGAELRATVARPGDAPLAAVSARLHGGGPFANARLRVLARIEATPLNVEHPLARTYQYDVFAPDAREPAPLLDRADRLDAQGQWQGALAVPPDSAVRHGRIVLEGSVFDDRGRSIAATGSLPYQGRDRYIGLRDETWVAREGRPAEVGALVIDAGGTPMAGVPYYVKIERKHTRGARVKGAGNAYLTRYSHEWIRVETCKGRSTRDGMICRFIPDAAGEYRVIALVRDSQDRLHESRSWLYAQGRSEVLWEERPDYSLELRAERARWKVGETARFMVRNPFPGARALISVERYGVLEQRVQLLGGPAPVIEIPVKPEFVPGGYVSVVVVSPRVEPPLKGAVDLGKPTFRLGYATLTVDEPYRRIAVDVEPARALYRPRETVEVALQARPLHADGQPIEFAVAVLDEAVFDLIRGGADHFDPLKGFTTLDPLDLANYSLLTRLVGRQKFEKKGASPGGDGGADLSLRSIERFVAYWNPALPADAQNRARFSFTLPDQLTGWRVLALATTPTDRMGLGQNGVKVSKPTELRPAMPNLVAAGDRFDAAFTLLNRDAKRRTLDVEIDVQGGAEGRLRRSVTLESFERQTVSLPVEVVGAEPLRFSARAGDAGDRDALAHTVPVRAPRVSTSAADLASLAGGARIQQAIAVPADARSRRLELQIAPTLVGPLDGAFAYLRDYPYLCWEQRLSKAVMAAHYGPLRARFGAVFDWPQADALPQATLDEAAAFQAPNGGMAFFVPGDAYVSPYLSAFTGLAFGWMQALGHRPPTAVWDKLDAYLQRLLREEPAAIGYGSGEARAQLRAVVLAALAARGAVDAREIARHAPQLPRMGLFGEALFLRAAQQVENGGAAAQAARNRVLSRANESAGRMSLQDERDADWNWLLGSAMRSNCAALSALIADDERPGLGELPFKLVRHVLSARGTKTHWANTQENLFCARALLDYANAYEAEPPDLRIDARLGDAALGTVRVVPGPVQTLTHPLDTAGPAPQQVAVTADGQGRAYLTTRVQYVEADDRPALSAGLGMQRSYAVQRDGRWQTLEPPLRLRRGELLKVELTVDAPAWMTYVVVDDPVPGGIEPLNPDLATASGIDAQALASGSAYPYPFYHRELRFDAVRHYAEWLPQGRHRLVWVGQAVATGEFAIGRPHAEQMYDPDVFGNGVSARLIVEEAAP